MASCTRIDQCLQAYLDGELPHSERVVLDLHLEDCATCRASLQAQRQANAILFESFRPVRLQDDMSDYVLSHLPDMEHRQVDVAGVNRRVKHPARFREQMFRLVPIAAMFLLVGMAAVINSQWPEPDLVDESIGLVAAKTGESYRIADGRGDRRDVMVRDGAEPGDRFETGAGSSLMLMLMGPSELRMDQNTRVAIEDERTIEVYGGRVFLDVAKGRDLFRVRTPHGEVTVFGTRFDVRVGADDVQVIVEEGRVQLSSTDGRGLFRVLTRNQQGHLRDDASTILVDRIDASRATRWAFRIEPETDAREYFLTSVAPRYDADEVNAENVWLISTGDKVLQSVVLEWEPVPSYRSYKDYEIFVYTPDNEPIFLKRVGGAQFSDPGATELVLENTGDTTERHGAVVVKAVPTGASGASEITFSRVYAVLGN